MIPKIGITTQIIHRAKWYKYISDLGFDTIEINRQNSKLHFNLFFLEKVKRYTAGYDLSVHSGTAGIFQPHEHFTEANFAVVTAEVDVCAILGAKQLIFHLNDGILADSNKMRLKNLISYAKDQHVEMMYESNRAMRAQYAYDVLESFPEIGYVLDLGHLNNGYGTGTLGCTIDDFIQKVKDRVVYIHASNNSGTRDEHMGLDQGTLDWRYVMNLLDLSQVKKIIIEVRFPEMVEDTFNHLKKYLDDRFA